MDEFASMQPLEGGRSGETFLAEAGGDRTVVRIFAGLRHPPEAAQVQEALLTLVRGLLPVPEVLDVRRADPEAGMPALLVTSFLPGTRGDLLLPALDRPGLARLGAACGRIAGVLGGMPLLRRGTFTDAQLRIAPFDIDLPAYVETLELGLPGLAEVAEEAQALLDEETRTCLVHSDLDPTNLLVDPQTLEVTGVLGARPRRPPLRRPRQPAALRPGPCVRRRRAGVVRRPARHPAGTSARAGACCGPRGAPRAGVAGR